ncbi:MAG: DUF4364 family protein [Lachnospiraceae bacterium]|nr:DUF4364 family protein [Lachnospiraceae bacterium]
MEIDFTYKIIVLRLLDKASSPVSSFKLAEFFVEYNYTDYFTAQQAIGDVVDSNMVNVIKSHGNTSYTLNDEGRQSLELFADKINEDIEQDIISYYKDNEISIRKEQSVSSSYHPISPKGYMVNCKIMNTGLSGVDYEVNCVVMSKEQAEAICNNWKVRYEELYFHFLDELTR